jgi:multisubunit Na+/H+ antiporter MnhG subunit
MFSPQRSPLLQSDKIFLGLNLFSLMLTLPLASHALARAALKETGDKPPPKRARQTHMLE